MASKIHAGMVATLGVFFLFTGMAFGMTKQINVIYHATVGKSLILTPGKYRIDVTGNAKTSEVQFYNHSGQLVGQVPAKVVKESLRNRLSEVDYNNPARNRHVLTEISPRGWKENLVFNHSNAD